MLSEIEIAFRLLFAAFLGGIIGLERESINRAAGFRTHILVSLGSCMIMLVSFSVANSAPAGLGDPGRIAAQVVSGIGFLGAGSIISSNGMVKGLTTAATLWSVAGVGLAVGAGIYYAAAFCAALIYISLRYFPYLERLLYEKKQIYKILIIVEDKISNIRIISELLQEEDVVIKDIRTELNESERDKVGLVFFVRIPTRITIKSILNKIEALDDVYKVELD